LQPEARCFPKADPSLHDNGESGDSGNIYEEDNEEVAQQTEKGLDEREPVSGQPTIQGREKMKASKRKVAKEDLKTNLIGDRERGEGGDPGTETLVPDNVTHASRFLRSKVGGTQPTSRRGRGRGRGMAQVNLGDSRSTPLTPTGEGTSEDSGADVGASVEGILQILVS
jgi:hypothetical protein